MAETERNIVIDIQTKTHQAVSDIKRLNKEIDKLNKQNAGFKKTTNQVQQMTRSFASLATHLGRLALIYGAFQGLQTTVRTFAEFEQSMKRLGEISGATEEELASLEERAKLLGETTIFTASQVADGMNAMAMAGLTAEEQLQGIGSVLDLATIGMIGLDEASLIAVRTMNAFGLEAQDMSTVVDVLATGATSSAQTVTQLGNAFEKVGTVAKNYGVSLQETTSALEIMADAGRVGSEAGTQLKIVMSRLAGNKEALKYIDALGVSMYDANNKLLPFKDQLIILRDSLGTLDEKARNIKLGEIFGEEGKASAILLLDNMDKYDAKLKDLTNNFGVSSKIAKELQDTLIGSWQELQSALEGLAIKIGAELSPVLRSLTDDATDFVQSLSPAEVEKFAQDIAGLLQVLADFGKAMVRVVSTMSLLFGAFEQLGGVSVSLGIAITALAMKLKKFAIALATTNPAVAILVASFIALELALAEVLSDLSNFNSAMSGSNLAMDKAESAMDKYVNTTDKLNLAETEEGQRTLAGSLKDLERELKRVEAQQKSYKEQWLKLSSAEKDYVVGLGYLQTDLEGVIKKTKESITTIDERGVVLRKARTLEIKLLNDVRRATNQTALAGNDLTEAQITDIQKVITKMKTREVALEKTLGTMKQKERKYRDDIEKLEKEIDDIRKKYSDERLSAEFSLQTKIANVQALGLNDLQAYNDAQLRADKILAQAKEALASGNLEMAKTYLSEYDSLIQQSAGEEIKVDDKVKKTKKATAGEYVNDAKAGHLVLMGIINEQERRDIEATNAKIDAKQLELDMMLLSIKLQQQILAQIAQMITQATGIKFEMQYDEFNADMIAMEAKVTAFTEKQRKIKIEGDLSSFETDVDKATKDAEAKKIEPEVDPDTKKAVIKMEGFRRESEASDVLVPVNLDTDTAEQEHEGLKVEIAIPADKEVALGVGKAYELNDAFTRHASQDVIKFVKVYYTYPNGKPSGYMHGGLIGAQLPRYASGGLESGEGHSRKTGSLGGYGGGDKVKALLEAGEFIVRKEAVRALGIARLHAINSGVIPKFQHGGMVNPIQKFSTGGLTESNNSRKSGDTMELNLNLGGKTYSMVTQADVAYALARELKRGEF